jgi:hypothetical protein
MWDRLVRSMQSGWTRIEVCWQGPVGLGGTGLSDGTGLSIQWGQVGPASRLAGGVHVGSMVSLIDMYALIVSEIYY